MARKKRRLNLDIGYGGLPLRGTTIGLDESDYEYYPPDEHSLYGKTMEWGRGEYGRSKTEPLDPIQGNAYALPFKTGSLDRTTSQFAEGMHDFPQEGFGRRVPPFTYKEVDPYSQLPGIHEDFDPEEHWEALIESLRVLKPGGTTHHIWDSLVTVPVRKDPYYLSLMQLLKNHDMENIKIRLEDWKEQEELYGRLLNRYTFILTARKKR